MGLPGDVSRRYLEGKTCEDCKGEVKATVRLTGESDSFGSEYHYLCEKHYAVYKRHVVKNPLKGICDHCKSDNVEIKPWKDPDEGSCARIHYICNNCKKKAMAYYCD